MAENFTVPEGETLEDMIRRGMALETDGRNTKEAAEAIGMSRHFFGYARWVIILKDREDLRKKDKKIISEVVQRMNKTNLISPAYRSIQPILHRLYGPNRQGIDDKKMVNMEAARINNFLGGAMAVASAGHAMNEIDVPYLSKQQAKLAKEKLKEAIVQIEQTISSIEKEMC